MIKQFGSSKLFDGYSTVFRQWRAEGTHCKFLHGYGVSFRVWFIGELDEKNWVQDFGGFKRAIKTIDGKSPKVWLDWLLDHTTIIAEDDPYLPQFKQMDVDGIIQLRILPFVGAERFAEYLFNKLSSYIFDETGGRVWIDKIEVYEHEKNAASYGH